MATYLNLPGTSGAYAYTVDDASVDITGDIDVRVDVQMPDWTPSANQTLISKYTGTGNQRSWQLQIASNGTLRYLWSANGESPALFAVSTAALGATDGSRWCVRVTHDVDNGSGGNTVRFYWTVPGGIDGTGWFQIGNAVTATGTTSLFSSSADLIIGAENAGAGSNLNGRVYAAQVRDGIGGDIATYPIFSTWATTSTTFTDQYGRAWVRAGTSSIADDGTRAPNEEELNALSQEKYGVDLNRGLQLASGIRKDKNGVAHTLWGGREAHARRSQIAALLEGGGVVEESAPPHEGMSLVFEDDFETWDQDVWVPHPWYLDSWDDGMVSVENSVLRLTSSDSFPDAPSASLSSLGPRSEGVPHYPDAGSWQEGYFEARIKFTGHARSYPGFWMLSTAHPNTWPDESQCPLLRCEWDIMELGLSSSDPRRVTWMNSWDNNLEGLCETAATVETNRRDLPASVDLSDWHVWGGLWKDGRLTQFIDGVPMISRAAPASFNQPMYLILMADRHTTTGLPEMSLWVDWVRVWQ